MRTALALALLMTAAPALAEGPQPIHYQLEVDLAVTGGAGVAALLASTVFKDELAPIRCRMCVPGSLDDSVRTALVWSNTQKADLLSDVLSFGLPVGLVAYDLLAARHAGDVNAAWVDLLVMGEAAMISLDLEIAVKYIAARQRPYAYYGSLGGASSTDPDSLVSFYSGHTSFAFTEAAAAGTIARLRGYQGWPWVYAGGFAVAGAIGYFRVAADKHYLTDVVAGAAVGTAVGMLVPVLLHPRSGAASSSTQARLLPAPSGIAFVF